MPRGLVISSLAHLALILVALFAGDLFEPEEARAIQIAEVDLMTAAEFDAAVSTAPEAPRTDVPDLAPPEEGAADVTAPDAVEPLSSRRAETPEAPADETAPDVSALRSPSRAEVRTEAPRAPSPAGVEAAPEGASLVTPEVVGPRVPELQNRRREATRLENPAPPRPAPRIASEAAPKPPDAARTAEAASPEVAPSPEAVEPKPETPAEAPKEAATEIVPEVEKEPVEPESAAPLVAGRPRGRPTPPAIAETETAAAEVPEPPKPEPPAAEPPKPETPRPAAATPPRPAAPLAEPRPARTASATPRPASPSASDRPRGPPVTETEKDGIRLGIKKYWNVVTLSGLPDYQTLVVEVKIAVGRDGKIIGEIEPWKPKRPDGNFLRAFQVARRAVLQAERNGDLKFPSQEKYEQWKEIVLRFDPRTEKVGY